MEYYVNKRKFKKEDVEFAEIFFDNGDCFPILKTEIIDFSINLYDKLILGRDYWNPFCAVVQDGYIKLKLQKSAEGLYVDPHVCNIKEYNSDRISYIKNRLCNEGGVYCIKLFDEHNCHFSLYCQVETIQDGKFLNLKFLPLYKKAEYKSDKHTILLPEVDKSIIRNIELDFENCEGTSIYSSEIIEMRLKFNNELYYGSGDYVRQIESGYLKIKLNFELNENRGNDAFSIIKGNKQIIRRLCGKRGFELHDVCHLYINYDYDGWGLYKRECLEINDIRSDEEFKEMEKWAEREGRDFMPYFLGGYAERLDKDTLIITFGETALKDKRCQSELKKCSIFNIKDE